MNSIDIFYRFSIVIQSNNIALCINFNIIIPEEI